MLADPREERFELLNRTPSSDSLDELDALRLDEPAAKHASHSTLHSLLPPRFQRALRRRLKACLPHRHPRRSLFTCLIRWTLGFLISLIVFTATFRPSYTHLPPHYKALEKRVLASQDIGRGNPNNESIYVCISLYDKGGRLAGGQWGQLLLDLIDLLGHENTFLSIYENGNGEAGHLALQALEAKVPCKKEIVFEDVDMSMYSTVPLQDGTQRIKRIVYLADVRNRALRPLDTSTDVKYDKILFLNDVFFDPIDAAQLLFSTNMGANGKTDYIATCALDFHDNPVKFYDTFATRDMGGYSMGVPFYPFFSSAGNAESRSDMIAQKDAVRVKSCWSGMAAFNAEHFQSNKIQVPEGFQDPGSRNIDPANPIPVSAPIRFRAEPEVFFDACECCLLMADALQLSKGTTDVEDDSGIYWNPFVRVAYSPGIYSWLRFLRRFERLYTWPQWFVNNVASMPTWNAHRQVLEGDAFEEEVWTDFANSTSAGHWNIQDRTGRNGLYCGVREIQVLRQSDKRVKDRNWENVPIPSGRKLF